LEIIVNKIHIAISAHDIAASIEDYSKRLGCRPCVVIASEYALWRTASVNFSIRQAKETIGTLRHLGWEDADATAFSNDIDVNGIEWDRFSAKVQAEEIRQVWSHIDYSPAAV
jgi:hypothetical protein